MNQLIDLESHLPSREVATAGHYEIYIQTVYNDDHIISSSLCQQCFAIKKAYNDKDFEKVVSLRGA